MVNNTDGSIVGYKYFNFTKTHGKRGLKLHLNLIPAGVEGTIVVMADRPWKSQGGVELGRIELTSDMEQTATEFVVKVPQLAEMTGKHALYLLFSSPVKEQSICTLQDFVFGK